MGLSRAWNSGYGQTYVVKGSLFATDRKRITKNRYKENVIAIDVADEYGAMVKACTCPYNEEMLKNRKAICKNMLTNPFEKFERKRFLYYSKDLSVISMNHALYSQMEEADWVRVRRQMQEDLKNYYSEMGGI